VRKFRVANIRYLLLLPLLILLAASSPRDEGTSGDSDAASLERNRQLLQKWKTDPEHYARLQRDLRDFWALPEAKRQQLRQLDRDFYQLNSKTQKRLWNVAEHYTAWLERLPEDERRLIEQTTNTQERLRLIRTIRERQWIERLPRKVREDLERLPAKEKTSRIALLRKQEQRQRQLWSRPIPNKKQAK
jgi:hypothetical protein